MKRKIPSTERRKRKKSLIDQTETRFLGDFGQKEYATNQEDNAIQQLVLKYGNKRWTLISKMLGEEFHIHGRSGKQCRERYPSH